MLTPDTNPRNKKEQNQGRIENFANPDFLLGVINFIQENASNIFRDLWNVYSKDNVSNLFNKQVEFFLIFLTMIYFLAEPKEPQEEIDLKTRLSKGLEILKQKLNEINKNGTNLLNEALKLIEYYINTDAIECFFSMINAILQKLQLEENNGLRENFNGLFK